MPLTRVAVRLVRSVLALYDAVADHVALEAARCLHGGGGSHAEVVAAEKVSRSRAVVRASAGLVRVVGAVRQTVASQGQAQAAPVRAGELVRRAQRDCGGERQRLVVGTWQRLTTPLQLYIVFLWGGCYCVFVLTLQAQSIKCFQFHSLLLLQ